MDFAPDIANLIAISGQEITLEQPADTLDAVGSRINVWTQVGNLIPAWIQDASSDLVESYMRRELHVTHSIYLLTNPGITDGWRIVFGTKIFKVVAIRNAAGLGVLYRVDATEHVVGA